MKLTKKLEAEILKAYNTIWDAYLKGDMKTFASILDENCYIIGSAAAEVFNNKKSAVKYYKSTSEQITGKAEMRNRKINVMPADKGFMVNEESDFYLLIDDQWTFYGPARISSLFHKKNNKWKVIHQHGSFPDSKTEGGEQVNTEKIKAENIQLRDAVKRRTVELEQKNRELEIESSLEKVRAQALGMHKPDDLLNVCKVLFKEFSLLGFSDIRNAVIHTFNDEENYFIDYDYSDLTGGVITNIPYSGNPVIERFLKQIRKSNEAFGEITVKGKELNEWKKFRKSGGQPDDPRLDKTTALYYYFHSVGTGDIGISTFNSVNEEKLQLLKRFRNVFDLAYKRYTDIKNAEAQTREAEIELALERVRAKTMAMQKPSEFVDVITVIGEQFVQLGFDIEWANFGANGLEVANGIDIWNFAVIPGGDPMSARVFIPYFDHPVFIKAVEGLDEYRKTGNDLFKIAFGKKDKDHWLDQFFTKTVFKDVPDEYKAIQYAKPGYTTSNLALKDTWLSIGKFDVKDFTDEQHAILRRFGKAFGQAYTRFLDLQKAEAQAREAQIEAGLERVRSRAMAMQTSEELNELIGTVFTELTKLDLVLTRCVILIYEGNENGVRWWMANSEAPSTPMNFFVKYADLPFFNDYLRGWHERSLKWEYILEGEDKIRTDNVLFNETELSQLPDFVIAGMKANDRVYLSASFNNYGCLNLASLEPLSDEHFDILLRFAKVFDLTYTRFNDLKQAEAQAREAQIETALERVRSRTMAMHQTSELQEVIHTVHKELLNLNLSIDGGSFVVINDDVGPELRCWGSGGTANTSEEVCVPHFNMPFCTNLIKGIKEGPGFFTEEFFQKEKKEYFTKLFEHKPWSDLSREQKEETLTSMDGYTRSVAVSKYTSIFIINHHGGKFTAAENDILKRFAKVFEQAYTRFLDLQKAEAQARESQIQLALERVRARTMAMQKSEELSETSFVLFQQFRDLGSTASQMSIGIIHENENLMEMSATIGGNQLDYVINVSLDEPIVMKKLVTAWQEQKRSLVIDICGDELRKYNEYRNSIGGKFKFETKEGDHWIVHIAFFSNGILSFSSHELHSDETVRLLERFAAVFEQTYTRFLDLQKAEAQTREAQIEAALERVRSRAMAMHKTDELLDAAELIYRELSALGVTSMNISYAFVDEKEKYGSYYSVNPVDGKTLPFPFKFPHTETEVMLSLLSSWKKKELFNVIELDEKATLKHQTYIGEHIQKQIAENNPEIPFTVDAFLAISPKKAVIYNFNFTQGYIFIIGSAHLTTEQEQMLLRFTKVFDLTYRRFLDLKQAEAQAREAQIELALERVRARTMAMHRSEELAETAQVLFHQLQELGGIPDRIAIGVVDEPEGVVYFWTTDQLGSHIDKGFKARLNERTVISKTYQAWKENKRSLVIDLRGDDVKEWIKFAREEMGIAVKDEFIKDRRAHNLAFFSHGWILVSSHEPQSAETIQILERFASVFNLTYRRFLDLQKAEAQANEARIEISLERIRSRALAMHKSDELMEVAKVVWEQMTMLGQRELESSVVHLYEEDPDHIHSYRAVSISPDSNTTLTYGHMAIPKNSCEFVREWLVKFYSDLTEYTIELSGAEQQEWYELLFKLAPDVVNSMRQKGDIHQKRYYRFSKFSGGALLMVSKQEPLDETSYLQRRAAVVFDLAYRRFSDLQKAEEQARESQIEAALEKVRASAMAMHNSEHVSEATAVLFSELDKLGIETMRCGIVIIHENQTMETWSATTTDEKKVIRISGLLDMTKHPLLRGGFKDWKNKEEVYTYHLAGKDMENYYDFLAESPFYPIPKQRPDMPEHDCTIIYFKEGGVYTFSEKPHDDPTLQVLKRFASVFSLTYRRYNDLKNAEAQAREAQIEAALERVRAKAMAMHKSEDLNSAVATVFEELDKLDLGVLRCGICILDKEKRTGDIWVTSITDQGSAVQVSGDESFDIHPLLEGAFESWLKQEDFSYLLDGDDLAEYYKAVKAANFQLPESQLITSETEFKKQYFHTTPYGAGGLFAFRETEFPAEAKTVLKRFAGVFDLTYKRFLDLQKAEANAREAQIEAGLERVRAKAMAMHSSRDLAETLSVFYRELKSLSAIPIRCGVALMDKETRMAELTTMNTTGQGDSIEIIGKIKMAGHPVLDGVFENWLIQKEFHAILRGNQIKEYYQVLKPQISYLDYSHDEVQFGYYFMFKEGDVYAWTEKELTEGDLTIYRRFTTVISLTYKRYKDLQQAEAQAREAKIEAGLERVRARTMAMHSSEDVSAATATMFTELEKLGIQNYRGGITNILSNGTQDVWSINSLAEGKIVKAVGSFSMNAHPFWQFMYKEWEAKNDFLHYYLAGQDKENYIKVLNAAQGYLPQAIQQFPDVHFQVYFFNEGAVWTNSLQPHSEEDKQVMKRFTSVFSLTFRRYQDLKKAEAQAREATIEAALERVRGKAMAMHNSQDLTDTIGVFYKELQSFSLTPRRCGVGLLDKEEKIGELFTWNTTEKGESLELVGKLKMEGHPVLEGVYEHWVTQKEYHPVLRGNEIKEYYKIIRPQIAFPDYEHDAVQYGYFFFFKEGGVYAWTEKEMREDELQIYRRFTSVLSLTYKRYRDLKQAEASANEAIRQASLDRVRAEIASMRTVEDLQRITPVIWNELTTLNIPFIRCGIFIMDDTQQVIHTFLSTPDGKAIAAFHLPYNTPGNIGLVINNWRNKKQYIDHWDESEFHQFAQILVQQRALDSAENYLKTIPHGGFYLHFLPFLQGMLYVGNTTQLKEEEIELIQHVADAFSTAYARYEDFNKLEAAKEQVEKTLTDLKQAQTQLVQSEKMASLGELTAGIAHEIQNPLNFVNNFSDVSNELLEEMKNELEKGNADDAMAIVEDIRQNLEKILHHGKRADAIVKGMLQHSRTSSGQKEPTDINMLADEYLRLAFHGLRAKDKSFNAKFETGFDNSIGKINIIPQDIGRVILNLINNAFYAVTEKKKQESNGYEPIVTVYTKKIDDKIEIKVKDNGNGIPQKVLDKIFQPFFTTKPTGQGTGLGLSLSYDIVTKGHGGELKVSTKEGEGSEFVIQLPTN